MVTVFSICGKSSLGRIENQLFGQSGSMSAMFASLVAVVTATSAWDTWRNATDDSKVLDPSALAAVDSVAAMIGDFEMGAASLASLTAIAAKHQLPPWQS